MLSTFQQIHKAPTTAKQRPPPLCFSHDILTPYFVLASDLHIWLVRVVSSLCGNAAIRGVESNRSKP